MHKYSIGATLIFAGKDNSTYTAILKSYVLSSHTCKEMLDEAKEIGKNQTFINMNGETARLEYIGIEDVFRVYGPIKEGALLGRMTLYNKNLNKAKRLVKNPEQFTLNEQLKEFVGKWYLAVSLYYIHSNDPESIRIISCYCLVETADSAKVVDRSLLIANSSAFQDKIVESDMEGLAKNELHFVGFEDIFVVYDDIQHGGSFMKLSKTFQSIDSIRSIIDDEKIHDFFQVE